MPRGSQEKPTTQGGQETPFDVYRQGGSTAPIRFTIALVLVARRWRSLIDERLRPMAQSSARMEALSAIMNSSGPNAQIEIANRLRIEGPTMTRMIDVLSRDGLVERRPAPGDRRIKHLELTDAGFRALDEIFAVTDEMRARLLEDFSAEEIDRITDVLNLMLEKLDRGLGDPERAG